MNEIRTNTNRNDHAKNHKKTSDFCLRCIQSSRRQIVNVARVDMHLFVRVFRHKTRKCDKFGKGVYLPTTASYISKDDLSQKSK